MRDYFSAIVLLLALHSDTIHFSYCAPAATFDKNLCGRFPSWAFCRSRRQAPSNTPKGDDESTVYCAKWDQHYAFYCDGFGSGDQRARDFCPYYKKICVVKTRQQFVTPPPLPNPAVGGQSVNNQSNSFTPIQTPPVNPPQPAPSQSFIQPQQFQQQPPPPPSPFSNPNSFQGNQGGGGGAGGGGGRFGGAGSIGQPLSFLGGPNSAVAGTANGIPGAGSPLALGQGFGVGPLAGAYRGTNINPLSGVGTGTSVNAGGLPISAGRGISFGGLLPGGLGNLFGR